MRRLTLAATLFLAACSTTPAPQPASVVRPVQPTTVPLERGDLIGATADDLMRRFGPSALVVREGDGLKLQYRGTACVLDAYLYPDRGTPRVAHIDARTLAGTTTGKSACIASFPPR